MESEVVNTGSYIVNLYQNQYLYGDTIVLKYRTAATEGACLAAEWVVYTGFFISLGYTQVRVEVTE